MPLGNLRQQKSKIRPVKQPRPIPVKQPRPGVQLGIGPGVQPLPSPVKQTGPSIQYGVQPLPSPGMQQPANSFGGLAEGFLRQQPGMAPQPASSALNDFMKRYAPFGDQPRDPNMFSSTPTRPPGMQQPAPGGYNMLHGGNLGMARPDLQPLPAAPGPLGGQLKLTQPAPMQQQAAPAQRVSTMKKGGIVRGGRSEIKGTRPAKLY